jgi:hypothetical protein
MPSFSRLKEAFTFEKSRYFVHSERREALIQWHSRNDKNHFRGIPKIYKLQGANKTGKWREVFM